jgi:hypothetical protein
MSPPTKKSDNQWASPLRKHGAASQVSEVVVVKASTQPAPTPVGPFSPTDGQAPAAPRPPLTDMPLNAAEQARHSPSKSCGEVNVSESLADFHDPMCAPREDDRFVLSPGNHPPEASVLQRGWEKVYHYGSATLNGKTTEMTVDRAPRYPHLVLRVRLAVIVVYRREIGKTGE